MLLYPLEVSFHRAKPEKLLKLEMNTLAFIGRKQGSIFHQTIVITTERESVDQRENCGSYFIANLFADGCFSAIQKTLGILLICLLLAPISLQQSDSDSQQDIIPCPEETS